MTRLCASLGSLSDIGRIGGADMAEARMDILGRVPDVPGKGLIVTFRDAPDLSLLPEGFSGMVDVGGHDVPASSYRVISSHHDFDSTPPAEEIAGILNGMRGDVKKGAFTVNSLSDLKSLHDASRLVEGERILLGMGALGTVTRIRGYALGNELTFAYVSEPTAPGQLSLEEMSYLGDRPMVTGILGHPLDKSLSPKMHNAAMRRLGIRGIYLRLDVESLDCIGDVVADYDIRGLNVTIPHKTAIMEHLDSLDKGAEAIGAVNTVVNGGGRLEGHNTDALGAEYALEAAGFDPAGKRALVMGSGGAARACAYALVKKGCRVTVTGRNEDTSRAICRDFGCEFRPKESAALMLHDLVVNCTPVGMYGGGDYPVDMCQLTRHHTVFDMVYGAETPLVRRAREVGAGIVSGEDMLAAQGAASLEMWTGKKDLFKHMREALG